MGILVSSADEWIGCDGVQQALRQLDELVRQEIDEGHIRYLSEWIGIILRR